MTNRLSFLEFLKRRSAKRTLSESRVNTDIYKDVLIESVQGILQVLSGLKIPYAIIGGHAISFHGRPRTTKDVDLLVSSHDIQRIASALNLQDQRPITIGGLAGVTADGHELDLISPNQSWTDEAVRSAKPTQYGNMISSPYLVLMKLWASRGAQDDTDMLYVLKNMDKATLIQTKRLVKKHLPNEVEDLESLISMADYA